MDAQDSAGEQPRRAMVVVAHADDAEWVCSGTVAKWCAEGWQVVYVLCTDGSKGSDDPDMTGPPTGKAAARGTVGCRASPGPP